MHLTLEIKRNTSLEDVELLLGTLRPGKDPDEILIRLARNLGSNFFVRARVAALIGSVARRTKRLLVRDWHQDWNEQEIQQQFAASLPGLTAAVYSQRIDNEKKENIPIALERLRGSPEAVGGILERHVQRERVHLLREPTIERYEVLGKSISIVAVDESDHRATPLVFSGLMSNRDAFIGTFLRLKRDHLEAGETPAFANPEEQEAEQHLATVVFEMFQNSYEHGCLEADGEVIPGIRFLTLTKHIANSPSEFLRRAVGFAELETYLKLRINQSLYTKLLEISISDHGQGIVSRFLHSPGGTQYSQGEADESTLLERIVSEPLTSKIGHRGAGYGLQRATDAVAELGGFLAIRTGSLSLTYHPSISGGYLFSCRGRPPIRGTHVNVLYPLKTE